MKEIIEVWTKTKGWLQFESEDKLKEFVANKIGKSVEDLDIVYSENGKSGELILKGTTKSNPLKKVRVLEGREWVVYALAGRSPTYLAAYGEDGKLYQLSVRVDKEVWNKIRDFFWYVNSEEDMEGMADFYGEDVRGWVCSGVNVEKVNKIIMDEAKRVATDIEREEAEIIRKEDEERKREEQEMREKKKREEEKRRREEQEKEQKIQDMIKVLDKMKPINEENWSPYLDWDWFKAHGCKHDDFRDMKLIMSEGYGTIHSYREFEVRYDDCTNTTIVLNKANADLWQWQYYEGNVEDMLKKESREVDMER